MLRLSKVTDYGIVLLAHLARQDEPSQNAREMAQEVDLPVPMVSKILKTLAREGLLTSQRGAKGGYALTASPEALSVADIIAALEGPVGLTQCTVGPDLCAHEGTCTVQGPWQVINRVVQESLARVTLADLIDSTFASSAAAEASLGPPASHLLQVTSRPARLE